MDQMRDGTDDGGGGNGEGVSGKSFDLEFPVEKYRFDSSKERLRGLFDQMLVDFMREKSVSKGIRPLPALCSDGRPVDLFKLFWVVRKIGGHGIVSRNNLWEFVSKECGLDLGAFPSIKLVYLTYLNELDQWLRQGFSKRVLEDGHSEFVQKLDLFAQEMEIRFRRLLLDGDDQDKKEKETTFVKDTIDNADISSIDNRFSTKQVENVCCGNGQSEGSVAENIVCEMPSDIEGSTNIDFGESEKRLVEKGVNEGKRCFEVLIEDNDSFVDSANNVSKKTKIKVLNCGEFIVAAGDDDREDERLSRNMDVGISAKKVVNTITSKPLVDNMILASGDTGNVLDSRKRKRQPQSFPELLKWLRHAAKHSNDPSVGAIPEFSKWGDCGNDEFWVQAKLIRETLLLRSYDDTNAGELLLKDVDQDQQKKPRMHPSMHEDDNLLNHQPPERLRCSKRIPSSPKSHFCPCCNSNSSVTAPQSKPIITHQESDVGKRSPKSTPSKSVVSDVEEPPKTISDEHPSDMPVERQVSVGPTFQAQVPDWTGIPSESDSKWFGTRMWFPEDGDCKSTVRLSPIGKGMKTLCSCPFPGSVECVRFHIAEKRLELRREIGSLFYQWRFDRMGEEVSLSWTEEEEKKFKDMIRSDAEFPNKFWNTAFRYFPSKTRAKLVSYYFNVFVVQRRSYQNRVTPKDVDSDDDEKECGSIGGCFGNKALFVPGSGLVSCSLNKQSVEFI